MRTFKNKQRMLYNLRGLFLITVLLTAVNLYSQAPPPTPPPIEINTVTTGYYTCYVDGKMIDQHNQLQKATTHCASLKANNPNAEVGFKYPEFTHIEVYGYKTIEIDTVQYHRTADLKGWIDYTKTPREIWLPFDNVGVIGFLSDTIYNWQSEYQFKRTKTFGKISYEPLDIPFQFAGVWLQDLDVYFRANEKPIRITSWIDDVKFKEFLPGHWDLVDGVWEAFFGIPADSSGKEFKLELENEQGKIITYKTTLKL